MMITNEAKHVTENVEVENQEEVAVQTEGKSSLLRDTRGLTTVEYIIILCLIACVGFGVWKKFGKTVSNRVGEADKTLNDMSGLEDPGTP